MGLLLHGSLTKFSRLYAYLPTHSRPLLIDCTFFHQRCLLHDVHVLLPGLPSLHLRILSRESSSYKSSYLSLPPIAELLWNRVSLHTETSLFNCLFLFFSDILSTLFSRLLPRAPTFSQRISEPLRSPSSVTIGHLHLLKALPFSSSVAQSPSHNNSSMLQSTPLFHYCGM